jgi:hypothetical protein
MNRQQRRAHEQFVNHLGPNEVADVVLMRELVRRMTTAAPKIELELRQLVGNREYNSGEALDGLLQVATQMELAAFSGDGEAFAKHAAAVLVIARDIALREGVLKPPSGPVD